MSGSAEIWWIPQGRWRYRVVAPTPTGGTVHSGGSFDLPRQTPDAELRAALERCEGPLADLPVAIRRGP